MKNKTTIEDKFNAHAGEMTSNNQVVVDADQTGMFQNLCGIWEGREDISLEKIRNKAWNRKVSNSNAKEI